MDGDADAAGEYERLRAELADFVMAALAERMAAGDLPELSRALAEAIDRRVDDAVSARLAQMEWPDPDAFADSVIAAAAGRGEGAVSAPRHRPRRDEERRPARTARRGMSGAMVALIGVALLAAAALAAYLFLRAWDEPVENTVVMNVQTNMVEPPPGAEPVPQQPAGTAAPAPAVADQNLQGTNP